MYITCTFLGDSIYNFTGALKRLLDVNIEILLRDCDVQNWEEKLKEKMV